MDVALGVAGDGRLFPVDLHDYAVVLAERGEVEGLTRAEAVRDEGLRGREVAPDQVVGGAQGEAAR